MESLCDVERDVLAFGDFTTNGERLGVTWPEPDVTFAVYNSRFERQGVAFHLSDLPQGLLPWILFYATYKC